MAAQRYRAAGKGYTADWLQVLKRYFQSQGEQEKRDSDFGKKLDLPNLGNCRSRSVGTHKNSRCNIPDKQGQPEHTREHTPNQTRDDN